MSSLDHEDRLGDEGGVAVEDRRARPGSRQPVPGKTNGGLSTSGTEAVVHRWRAFALLAVAYFMTIVDLTIVNVALPTIGRKLHFTESNLQWVVTAYGLTFGGFLLLGDEPPIYSDAGACS